MNKKKAGLIAGGVLVAALAGAPAAWAVGESVPADQPCAFTAQGEDASEESVIDTDNPVNTVVQAPVADDNVGKYGECSTFGENNYQGNNEGNTLNGQPVGEFPAFPGIPQQQ